VGKSKKNLRREITMAQITAKLTLEWRPGDVNEFPFGLKEELDDIERNDIRWKQFSIASTRLREKTGKMPTNVDDLLSAMKKEGLSTKDSIMFLRKLRRIGLVRFVTDNEVLMGMIDDVTFHLN